MNVFDATKLIVDEIKAGGISHCVIRAHDADQEDDIIDLDDGYFLGVGEWHKDESRVFWVNLSKYMPVGGNVMIADWRLDIDDKCQIADIVREVNLVVNEEMDDV